MNKLTTQPNNNCYAYVYDAYVRQKNDNNLYFVMYMINSPRSLIIIAMPTTMTQ